MQSGPTQARLRIRETLDAHPELTIILDASGSPSSRLRSRFLGQNDGAIRVHDGRDAGIDPQHQRLKHAQWAI